MQRFLLEIDTEIGVLIDKRAEQINTPGDMALLPHVKRFAQGGTQHLTAIQTDSYLSDEKI